MPWAKCFSFTALGKPSWLISNQGTGHRLAFLVYKSRHCPELQYFTFPGCMTRVHARGLYGSVEAHATVCAFVGCDMHIMYVVVTALICFVEWKSFFESHICLSSTERSISSPVDDIRFIYWRITLHLQRLYSQTILTNERFDGVDKRLSDVPFSFWCDQQIVGNSIPLYPEAISRLL